MMHLEITESTSNEEVYYSANRTSKSQSFSFKSTVENFTKTSKAEKVNRDYSFFEQEVFTSNSNYKSKVKVEEKSKMQDLFSALLQVGKSFKEKLRSFFKRNQNWS